MSTQQNILQEEGNYADLTINSENINSYPPQSLTPIDENLTQNERGKGNVEINAIPSKEIDNIPIQYQAPQGIMISPEIINPIQPNPQMDSQNKLLIVILILILNLIYPGIGTIVLGAAIKLDQRCKYIAIGILQLILTPLLIGWIWALVTSVLFWRESFNRP